MTQTIEREVTERVTSDKAPDAAHIVLVPRDQPDENSVAYVMRARIEGFAIVALCGYTWIPYRSAQGLPVCSACLAAYEYDPQGHGDRGELPDE